MATFFNEWHKDVNSKSGDLQTIKWHHILEMILSLWCQTAML